MKRSKTLTILLAFLLAFSLIPIAPQPVEGEEATRIPIETLLEAGEKDGGAKASAGDPSNQINNYEVVKKDISWSNAKAECEKKGGHLATITSRAENDRLTAMADQAGLSFVWLGGTTSMSGAGANGQWITGEDFSYTAWYDGEPSHQDDDGTPENCIEMWRLKSTGEWSWNDERNDPIGEHSGSAGSMTGNMGYICEFNY